MGLERAAIECCCEYEDEVELRPLWCPPLERGSYSPPTLLVVLVWLTFRESSERETKIVKSVHTSLLLHSCLHCCMPEVPEVTLVL